MLQLLANACTCLSDGIVLWLRGRRGVLQSGGLRRLPASSVRSGKATREQLSAAHASLRASAEGQTAADDAGVTYDGIFPEWLEARADFATLAKAPVQQVVQRREVAEHYIKSVLGGDPTASSRYFHGPRRSHMVRRCR